MKVSIIIPIYNVAEYIKECLLSVINQTYKDFEIILIDDCGHDNSIEIIKEIIKAHNFEHKTKLITHPCNKGLSAARNSGIKNAEGDYLYFLDSDDTISPDCLELLTLPLYKKEHDLIIGNYKIIGCDKNYPKLSLKDGEITGNNQILNTFINGYWYVMAWNKLINRKFILDNELYFTEGLIHEDEYWSFQVACNTTNIYIENKITYYYLIRNNSITQSYTPKNIYALVQIIELCTNYVIEKNLSSNLAIYNYLENFKIRVLFRFIKYKRYNEAFKTYIFFRQINLKENLYKHLLKNNFIRQIRDLHYLLPKKLGFYLFMLLINLKNK